MKTKEPIFEDYCGKIPKDVREYLNELMLNFQDINAKLRDLNVPLRVVAKKTESFKSLDEKSKFYYDMMEEVISDSRKF